MFSFSSCYAKRNGHTDVWVPLLSALQHCGDGVNLLNTSIFYFTYPILSFFVYCTFLHATRFAQGQDGLFQKEPGLVQYPCQGYLRMIVRLLFSLALFCFASLLSHRLNSSSTLSGRVTKRRFSNNLSRLIPSHLSIVLHHLFVPSPLHTVHVVFPTRTY